MHDVVIIGAGPVGLSAGLALSAAGIDVAICEAGQAIDRSLKASSWHPPTLDMLDRFGLGDELVALGRKVPRWQLRQHETGRQVEFDVATVADLTRHPYRLQCEQARFSELAARRLTATGIPVHFGRRLSGLTQDDDAVRLRFEDGSRLQARWAIGADGSGSHVRTTIGQAYGGRTYTHSSVLVTTPFAFEAVLPALCNVSYCWSARGSFTLLHLPDLWRVSMSTDIEDGADATEESHVRDWLAFIHPSARDADLVDIRPYRVHERCVQRFRVGRVLLAGDAAHLNPPSGGMGMNGGIHDAVNAADKLSQVVKGADPDLLDRYARQRRHAATASVIPQASGNRRRMATRDAAEQSRRLDELEAIVSDPERHRDFVFRASMFKSLEEAAGID